MSRILLVEDEAGTAALMRRYIEKSAPEHSLAAFARAVDALSYARSVHVDLFILDIQLLDYRGTQLAKQLRSMPEYRFTPILFTTQLAGEELSAYREIKCYDFLIKPFTQAEFRRAFQAALEMGARLGEAPAILRIEQKQFLFEYEVGTVLYVESFGKRLLIHTARNGAPEVADRVCGYSLSKILTLVPPDRLLQCHKSFLVNPDHISRIEKANRQLFLNGCKAAIPIGEKYQKNVLEREKP